VYYKKIIKVNSLIAIENGIQYMLPHREKIFSKDETYFDDDDTDTLVEKINTTQILKVLM
jgi:hypothetical protein